MKNTITVVNFLYQKKKKKRVEEEKKSVGLGTETGIARQKNTS